MDFGGFIVCPRCAEIDDRTERYRHLAKQVSDMKASEAIVQLIAKLAVEKLGLHPASKT